MVHAEKKKKREEEKREAQLYLDIVVKDPPPKGDPPDGSGGHVSTASDGGSPSACAPLGLLGLSPALVTKVSKWKRSTQTALVDLCTDFREQQPRSAERRPDSDMLASYRTGCDRVIIMLACLRYDKI